MARFWGETFGWWGRRLVMVAATLVAVTLISSAAPAHDAIIASSGTETMQPLSKLDKAFSVSEASAKRKGHAKKKHGRRHSGSGGSSGSGALGSGGSGSGGSGSSGSGSGDPLALGAYIDGAPWDPTKIDQFASMVGTPPKIVGWYESWSDTGFDAGRMDAASSRGAMPLVTWEPWDWRQGANQPNYALKTIARGDHDAYVQQWAKDAAAYGKPLYVRFAHEMNSDWFPWSAGANGNTAADYVAAWRHVHDVFAQEGATNVRWVWSPNVDDGSGISFSQVYPGDAYVDWAALDGYNWGTTQSWSKWTSLADTFGPSYDVLAKVTNKPVMIGETASAEAGGDKASWIRQGLLQDVSSRLPRVQAVMWFDVNKETDWRVNSSPTALLAFKEVAASPTYQGKLP